MMRAWASGFRERISGTAACESSFRAEKMSSTASCKGQGRVDGRSHPSWIFVKCLFPSVWALATPGRVDSPVPVLPQMGGGAQPKRGPIW